MDKENFEITSFEDETNGVSNENNEKSSKTNTLIKNTGFKCLGNIIKIIAFIVALAVIGVHALAAYILFAFRPLYISVCIAIVAFGLVLALIILFLIYALGHSINQNNEILSILKNQDKK